jgi:hypothetical protein
MTSFRQIEANRVMHSEVGFEGRSARQRPRRKCCPASIVRLVSWSDLKERPADLRSDAWENQETFARIVIIGAGSVGATVGDRSLLIAPRRGRT